MRTNYTCYTYKYPWPCIFNLTQILMSVTRKTTQMLWVSDPDVSVAVTTPALAPLAELAAPTQLLSLQSPPRSKQAWSSHRGGLGSSPSCWDAEVFLHCKVTSEAQGKASVKLLISHSLCSLRGRGKEDTACCCLQQGRWGFFWLWTFSLFTLEFATRERSEMGTSQSGTCAKVGKKWQWLRSSGNQQYREFI